MCVCVCVCVCVCFLAKTARFDLESSFARAFRGQQAIRVVSGNFFYSARPVGVKDGVDFLHTGRIRKVDTANFHNCLNNRDIVLLSPIGHGPSGETFNVQATTPSSELHNLEHHSLQINSHIHNLFIVW